MSVNEIFARNLKFFVIRSGQTQSQIAQALGVSKGTFSDWCSGRSLPRMNRVQQIADYFGISKSELVEDGKSDFEGDTAKLIRKINTNPQLKKLLCTAAKLNNADLALAVKLLERLDGKK